jgi:hypothetical protein
MQYLKQEIDIGQWDDLKQENAQSWIVCGDLIGLLSVIQGVLRGATNAHPRLRRFDWITFSDPGCLAGGATNALPSPSAI